MFYALQELLVLLQYHKGSSVLYSFVKLVHWSSKTDIQYDWKQRFKIGIRTQEHKKHRQTKILSYITWSDVNVLSQEVALTLSMFSWSFPIIFSYFDASVNPTVSPQTPRGPRSVLATSTSSPNPRLPCPLHFSHDVKLLLPLENLVFTGSTGNK